MPDDTQHTERIRLAEQRLRAVRNELEIAENELNSALNAIPGLEELAVELWAFFVEHFEEDPNDLIEEWHNNPGELLHDWQTLNIESERDNFRDLARRLQNIVMKHASSAQRDPDLSDPAKRDNA